MNEGKHRCPPHFWIIDSRNIGRCKYCGTVRDFRKALRKWFGKHKEASFSGATESKKQGEGQNESADR